MTLQPELDQENLIAIKKLSLIIPRNGLTDFNWFTFYLTENTVPTCSCTKDTIKLGGVSPTRVYWKKRSDVDEETGNGAIWSSTGIFADPTRPRTAPNSLPLKGKYPLNNRSFWRIVKKQLTHSIWWLLGSRLKWR